MLWIDGHLDLAYLAVNGRDLTAAEVDPAAGCVTLPALRGAGVVIAFGTIYTEPGVDPRQAPHGYRSSDDRAAAERAGLRQLVAYETLEHAGELSIVRTVDDLDGDGPVPKIVILMEGADPIATPDDVARWHEHGVRAVGLTWAMGTRYAGGNARPGPLTDEGRALVRALDDVGMIHDISHLADEATDELLSIATGPVVATHSNCRTLLGGGERHLRDDHLEEIGRRRGIIGLNLFTKFLARERRAEISDCVAHLEHAAATAGGRDRVALGSDMDGGFGPASLPSGLDHPSKLIRLAEALEAAGWSSDEIAGFACDNWLRFLERTLPEPRRQRTAAGIL